MEQKLAYSVALEDLRLTAEGVTRAQSHGKGVQGFMMVGPLASDFPSWTPYHYVHNNPINLIDPTGMFSEATWGTTTAKPCAEGGGGEGCPDAGNGEGGEATYGVDSQGNIKKIDDKKHFDQLGNEVDLLVKGGRVRFNKKGKIKNSRVEVEMGALSASKRKQATIAGKKYDCSFTRFSEDAGANKVFEFLAENTDVEWAIYQKDLGYTKQTDLFTSFMNDKEIVGSSLLVNDPAGLIYHRHSHPRTGSSGDMSRLSPSQEDKSMARRIRNQVPSAKFSVYFNYRVRNY